MTKIDFFNIVTKEVPTECKASIDNVYSFIPISILENMLDVFDWETNNFSYNIYKDGYANLCVAASIELKISYRNQEGKVITRTFVGACNFSINSIEPNPHFLATAKSECIKNAASDIGKYFGRGLNDGIVPVYKKAEKQVVKSKPDSKIMKQFLQAVEKKDEATITMLKNIYEIKTEEDAKEE